MSTRLYFSETLPSPVTPPAPSGGSEWEHIVSPIPARLLAMMPDFSSLTTTAYTPDAADHLTNQDACHRQYISEMLEAQTLTGTVTGQFQALEAHANNQLFLSCKILVISQDGLTTRATLMALTWSSASEVGTSIANRTFPSTSLTNYTCVKGDRLLIEIGLGGNVTTATTGVQGHNGSLRFGGVATTGDLPVNNTQTGATYRPWMQFSMDVKFIPPLALQNYYGVRVPTGFGCSERIR